MKYTEKYPDLKPGEFGSALIFHGDWALECCSCHEDTYFRCDDFTPPANVCSEECLEAWWEVYIARTQPAAEKKMRQLGAIV